MKEYEYIVKAVEGYLCDELTCLICSENYRNKSYDSGYRTLFSNYQKLHESFIYNYKRYTDPTQEASVTKEIDYLFCKKQQQAQSQFLTDIQACTKIDMHCIAKHYLAVLEEEEMQTVAKRICLYPHLVSMFREQRKEGGEFDGQVF